MITEKYHFEFSVYDSIQELSKEDAALLQQAREITKVAYAPYSNFLVGASAKLVNGSIVHGTNQENASYPIGICAERVLLASASMLFPNEPIDTIAISYHNLNGTSNKPVSPCGMCRQSLAEFENRTKHPIRLILAGLEGKIMIVQQSTMLLPFSFSGDDIQ
jgi:cytidine deaminase